MSCLTTWSARRSLPHQRIAVPVRTRDAYPRLLEGIRRLGQFLEPLGKELLSLLQEQRPAWMWLSLLLIWKSTVTVHWQ